MTNPNDPAFKDIHYPSSGEHVHSNCFQNLTKREYFAAMALSGFVATTPNLPKHLSDSATFLFAKASVEMADALIAELNK